MPAASGRSVPVFRPVYPSVRFSFKMQAFCVCSEAASGDVRHQSHGFDDLKRSNEITIGEDFIVGEMKI